jgi:predicted  nucleic acid-binding Zn-ribbon protein
MTTQEQIAALQTRLTEYENDAKALNEGIVNMQKNIAANNGALQYNQTLAERIRKRLVELDAIAVESLVKKT